MSPSASGPREPRPWSHSTRSVSGMVVSAVALALGALVVGDAVARGRADLVWRLAPWLCFGVWVIAASLSASSLRLSARGVVVQNLLRRHAFGWGAVEDVRLRGRLQFVLRGGRVVSAFATPGLARPFAPWHRGEELLPPAVRFATQVREAWASHEDSSDAGVRSGWAPAWTVSLVAILAWITVASFWKI